MKLKSVDNSFVASIQTTIVQADFAFHFAYSVKQMAYYLNASWYSLWFQTTGPADDIFTASTQTAVVLAELAVDTDDPLSQTLADDLNATGFLIEEDTLALEVSVHRISL